MGVGELVLYLGIHDNAKRVVDKAPGKFRTERKIENLDQTQTCLRYRTQRGTCKEISRHVKNNNNNKNRTMVLQKARKENVSRMQEWSIVPCAPEVK